MIIINIIIQRGPGKYIVQHTRCTRAEKARGYGLQKKKADHKIIIDARVELFYLFIFFFRVKLITRSIKYNIIHVHRQ